MAAADLGTIAGAAMGASGLDWFKAASPILSGVLGGSGPAAPSRADSSANQSSMFDSSGWQVATGGNGSNSATGSNTVMYLLIGAALILGVKYLKKFN